MAVHFYRDMCNCRSKLAGESVVTQTRRLKSCVLRVPVLYGPVESVAESAITVLLNPVLARKADSMVMNSVYG